MANEDLDDKDLEKDDDLEQEEEQEEESTEESSEEKAGEEGKKEEQHEGGESGVDEEPKDEEREALKARRRREKKMKRERQRRERFEHQNQISELSTIVKQQGELINKLQKGSTENEVARLDSEMQDCQRVYQEAQLVMERAITENNGQNFRKAKEISDKAWARYNNLELTKRQRPGSAKATGDSRGDSVRSFSSDEGSTVAGADKSDRPTIKLGSNAVQYGTEFQRRHSSWYKANQNTGQAMNLDSTIVQLLDRDLYNEGYDPETKDYWDELEDRMKERIPHRFKNQSSQKTKPKIITGGGGNEGSSAGSEVEKRLPKEFVEAMKMSGNYDDPKKRKAYIDSYMKNQKAKKG